MFKVLTFTNVEPTPRILPMGLFDVVVTQDTLDFVKAGREVPIITPMKRPTVRKQRIVRRKTCLPLVLV